MVEKHVIDELTPDPENLRLHGERNMQLIRESIATFGVNRPIVVDEDGVVLAGNGVLEAARAAGIKKVRKVEVDGNTIVAVQVSHLTDEQKMQYSVADNRANELSEWNTDALAKAVHDGLDITGFFFENELSRMLGDALRTEEEQIAFEERQQELIKMDERRSANDGLVVCPHCFHEWTPEESDAEGGSA